MKKIVSLVALASLTLATGCATTGTTTETSTANTPITLDEALQKAAETRKKLEEAQTAYKNAKAAAQASKQNGTSITTELAKQAIQTKIDNTKNQVNTEIQAWKDLLSE